MGNENIKWCPGCKTDKYVSEFHKNKSKKDGLSLHCKICNRQYQQDHKAEKAIYLKKYQQDNKEALAAKKKIYREEHKLEISKIQKQYYEDNKVAVNIKVTRYRNENKGKIAERDRKYRENNKEKLTMSKKQYQIKNKDKIAAYERQRSKDNKIELAAYRKQYIQTERGKALHRIAGHKRRALKYNGEYEVFDSIEIFERDGYRCQHCNKKTRPDYKDTNHPLYPNLDHIIPLSKGGDHTRLNTQCLCHLCNSKKYNNANGEQLRLFG